MKLRLLEVVGVAAVIAAAPFTAHATNGYFSHGYGTKSKGLAGGGIALPQDAMAAATNPAGMVFVGSRIDLGAALFSPRRGYGAPATNIFPNSGPDGADVDSKKEWFVIPHFAVNYMLGENRSMGVAMYGNGGMNTTYRASDTASNFGTYLAGVDTGVDLMQLFVNVNYAQKIRERASVGVGVILAAQRFEARGFDVFGNFGFSTNPDHLTHVGKDYSFGGGFKLGAQGDVVDGLTLAASYQSRIYMSEFEEYKGLFAEQGDFDIPPTATIGVAWRATPSTVVTFDVQKTWFSDVDSVGNAMSLLGECTPFDADDPQCLGGNQGAGFGWDDMTIYKLGLQWQSGKDWTWRIGYSRTDQPITNDNVLFNVVAPAVMEEHFTFGFTRQMGKDSELSLAAFYAPENKVRGDGSSAFNAFGVPDDSVEIYMKQFEIEASWAWKF